MSKHVEPFLSPISRVVSQDEGSHLGTGAYLDIEGSTYLITNEHVAVHISKSPLAHQFFGSDLVIRLTNPLFACPLPIDVALCRIDQEILSRGNHSARAIPLHQFAQKHETVKGELLFSVGYSGERSQFIFETLISPGTPYLTQECDFPVDTGDLNFHFALEYKPDLARSIDGSSRGLPDPHGLSGSLVWNTNRVSCLHEGIEWSPERAQVTGLVWGRASSAACILATRVEHLKLQEIVQEMSRAV
jgi:hypothetical protein